MIYVMCLIGFSLIGGIIGSRRGQKESGIIWGALLGPVGWLIVMALPDLNTYCFFCRERVDKEASICPHCRSQLHPSGNGLL